MKSLRVIKLLLFFFSLTTLIYSCQDKTMKVNSFSLNSEGGIYRYQEKLYTGIVMDTTRYGRVFLTFKCIEGKIDGEYLNYDSGNGNLTQKTTYLNGKKTGEYLKLNKKGDYIIKGGYLDDMKNGEWNEYYESGNLKSSGFYEIDFQTGEWQYFYPNGNIKREGVYLKGNESNFSDSGIPINGRFGKWKFYFEDNGNLELEVEYENGVRSGLFIAYYKNGQISLKANFKNDSYHGVIEVFDKSGKVELKELYENGKLVNE